MKALIRFWYGRYRDLRLAEKMIIVYALMLGLCALISVAALQVSFTIYDEKLYEKSLQELDFFTQEVNRSIDAAEEVSYRAAMEASIQEQLTKMQSLKASPADYAYEAYQLRDLLSNELADSSLVSNILYTDGGSTHFVVGTATGTIRSDLFHSLLERFHKARGACVMQQPTAEYPYLLLGRDIRKYLDASLDYLGSIILTCDISGVIEKNIDSLEAESASLCVYSGQDTIYESQEHMRERLPALEGESGHQILAGQGGKYFLCYVKSSKTGWIYVNIFPYSEIYGQNQSLRYLMIGGFLLLFFASALILKKLAHLTLQPLERLTESMQIVETGDFAQARRFLGNSTQKDEIGQITQEFGIALDKINHLIHENYEKQLLLQDTKYKMLQAQINPHFLYNTLNSIHWMIRSGKNEEAAKMTVALGTILRAAMSGRPYVTIDEELDNLKKYITIQEYRYKSRIRFSLVCEATGTCLIPHMTLQPLVENAIYHGAERMLTPCVISAEVREADGFIILSVSDNGPGMSQEELAAVRSFTVEAKGHGIGLKNIYERLRMAFGQQMDFRISSSCESGTVVTIKIPKMEVDSNDQGASGRR